MGKEKEEVEKTEEEQIEDLFKETLGDDVLNEKKLEFNFEVSDNVKLPIIPKNKITLKAGVNEIIELSKILSLRSSKGSILNPQVVKISEKKNIMTSSTNLVMYHKAIANLTNQHNVVDGVGDLVIDWDVFINKLETRFNNTDHVGMAFIPEQMKWICLRHPKTTTSITSMPYGKMVTWKDPEFKEIKEKGVLRGFEAYNQQLFNWIKIKASQLSNIVKLVDSFGQSHIPLTLNSTGELELNLKGVTDISKGEEFKDLIKLDKFHLEEDRVSSNFRDGIREFLGAVPSDEVVQIYFGNGTPLVACLDGKRSGVRFSSKTLIQPYSLK